MFCPPMGNRKSSLVCSIMMRHAVADSPCMLSTASLLSHGLYLILINSLGLKVSLVCSIDLVSYSLGCNDTITSCLNILSPNHKLLATLGQERSQLSASIQDPTVLHRTLWWLLRRFWSCWDHTVFNVLYYYCCFCLRQSRQFSFSTVGIASFVMGSIQ